MGLSEWQTLTRVELPLAARVRAVGSTVTVHDGTFPDRVGWHAVLPLPGHGTAVRANVPSDDPTGGLRRYPKDLLRSPAAVRDARLVVAPGAGTVTAPRGPHVAVSDRGSGGFAGILDDAAAGRGVLILLLAAAFGWGALHALSPGHGKTMVAAYLVGTRGSTRDAIALGATVTVTHTAGVVALGVVALALSAWILPEHLYPWLNLVSGLLVVGVGVQVLRSRLKKRHAHHHHHHDHHHTRRNVIALGASAGLIPCPTALVVLLGAIAQHQIALGLVLIAAFSAGLAATLTGLGLTVVHASRLLGRLRISGATTGVLSSASAGLVLLVGCVLTAQALPKLPL
jgi:ABC-type nickel/cobalt efflux system permease component RcnA